MLGIQHGISLLPEPPSVHYSAIAVDGGVREGRGGKWTGQAQVGLSGPLLQYC